MDDTCKYFTFDIYKYTGYRYIKEKSYLKTYEKIKYEGFEILYSNIFRFKIEKQIIRKLKLQNIDNNIRYGSPEYYIIQLLEKSEDNQHAFGLPDTTWYIYEGSMGTIGNSGSYVKKEEYKGRQNFQTKQYSQKIKQYENKGRFRK